MDRAYALREGVAACAARSFSASMCPLIFLRWITSSTASDWWRSSSESSSSVGPSTCLAAKVAVTPSGRPIRVSQAATSSTVHPRASIGRVGCGPGTQRNATQPLETIKHQSIQIRLKSIQTRLKLSVHLSNQSINASFGPFQRRK